MEKRGIKGLFHTHGFLCASHPVEVLLLCITGTVCLLTLSIYDATHFETSEGRLSVPVQNGKVPLPTGIHVHVSTTSYFLALLCVFLQCKKLLNTGSRYLVGIVSIFSVFSCLVYTSVIGNIFGGELAVLREALPFFFLLNDFFAVGTLAKTALLANSYEDTPIKIAQGVSTLGPSMTLNTLVGTLVIGVGTLSGVEELETASNFGCLALLTHYLIFMTFLPACLSLFLELCDRGKNAPQWLDGVDYTPDVHEHVPNPLLQHVKIIMSAGLMFVHVHSRLIKPHQGTGLGVSHQQDSDDWLSRFLAVNAEHVLAVVLALLVATKYFYNEKDDSTPLLESEETAKSRATSMPVIQTCHSPNADRLLPGVTGIVRKRRSTFTIGDGEFLGKEIIGSISENLQKDLLPLPAANKPEAFLLKIPEKSSNSPLKKTFSFPHQKLRSHSIRKNAVVPSNDIIVDKEQSEPQTTSQSQPLKTTTDVKTKPVEENTSPVAMATSGSVSMVTKLSGSASDEVSPMRSLEECRRIMKESDGVFRLSDEEICMLVEQKAIPGYQLESALQDFSRAVAIRRMVTARKISKRSDALAELPYDHYDYTRVSGACCENVIGYMPIPVGVAGPLLLDGQQFFVPMATTEGCLVASTNRGCSALMKSGGVRSSIIGNGMTRGPVMRLPSAMQASEVKLWLEDELNFQEIKTVFDSTSRFARLTSIKCAVAGRLLFTRFVATTGDAMGMNMLSKGTEKALQHLQEHFESIEVISLSGNYCTDKKATSINWIEGRGKSVVCEAIISGNIVTKVLKTTVSSLSELNISKNLVGSAMAGAIGGFNAHAANIVTAVFIATGQDPAQNVSSSNCITLMEPCGPRMEDLYISCTMPSIEVGTVGGGTILQPQASCLKMLGVQGASKVEPGQNAAQLARIVCATVLAGELSLLSALAAGHLVRSHLKHNRSTINLMTSEDVLKKCAVL